MCLLLWQFSVPHTLVICRFGSCCSPVAVDPVFLEYDDTSVLYRTVIKPIVTYASETWVLKETTIQKLLVFERKILRRIFGPMKENQIWRIKTSKELDKLIKHKNIVSYIKAQPRGLVVRVSDY